MRDESSLLINEIFYSIQGESSLAGYPCLFFRLSGCNLHCSYCDTRYACEEPGTLFTVADLAARADEKPDALIEITGGEPLLQEAVYPFMSLLLTKKRTVLLETNGSKSIARVPFGVKKIIDLKCPASGMEEKMLWDNLDLLIPGDEIKFVLSTRQDYQWAVAVMNKHALPDKVQVHFSPVRDRLAPAELAGWMLADCVRARLQLQLHRTLWPQTERGV